MNKKLFLGIAAITSSAILALTLGTAVGHISKADIVRGGAVETYSCADIVLTTSTAVDINPSRYADIATASTYYNNGIAANCSMTDFTNANYDTNTAIKIGGSKTGKYSGEFTLTLKNAYKYKVDKVIVYAAGWKGDTGTISLDINGVTHDISNTSSSATSYTFSSYTYQLTERTKTLVFKNDPSATGKRRLAISKIVFRLYAE